ncbi:hypothetical protein I79_007423 [Cricetulus griseus]|uniref:Uncharacterized protein n=1 Tax=Cricetulus griseus TaxID=10029 RepID=G3HAH2_CRIGR|nr:hypothetical protein I79_007423 [Cricetulus griseus]
MAETKRLMITSPIRMMPVRTRKEPRIGYRAITWEDSKASWSLQPVLTSGIYF